MQTPKWHNTATPQTKTKTQTAAQWKHQQTTKWMGALIKFTGQIFALACSVLKTQNMFSLCKVFMMKQRKWLTTHRQSELMKITSLATKGPAKDKHQALAQ